jgi:alpha-tubulin suppressor-like RCC1 family protein
VHPREFESFIAVAASHHSVAVKSDGTVWTWGPRENKGPTSGGSVVPVKVEGLDQVTAVAAGYEHNLAIRSDGTVWAWGDNRYGQLGDGSGADQERPVQVRGLTGVQAVAAGEGHSLALRGGDKSVWAWGGNYHGQLGDGSYVNAPFPQRLGLSSHARAAAIAAGDNHTIIIEEGTGQLWLCGWNIAGCIGIGETTTLDVQIPVKPVSNGAFTGTNIVAAAGGFYNSYAVDKSGRVWAWGNNSFNQLGPGTGSIRQDPTARQVQGLSGFIKNLSAGTYHCLALDRDGKLWSWGCNISGQVGQGAPVGPDQPPGRVALNHISAFSAGFGHSLAIARGG